MALEKYYDNEYYGLYNLNNATVTRAYPFSNEKLNKIFENLRKPFNRVLCVGSSGDQVLSSIYYGGRDITQFDANLFAKYFTEYKIAGIKNLPYEKFIEYFIEIQDPFSKDIYQKIFQDLSPDAQAFWGMIFLHENESQIIRSKMCFDVYESPYDNCMFYNNKRDYEKLQKILQEGDYSIKYKTCEIYDFPKYADGEYDLILLSNIQPYTREGGFKECVNNLYDNHLSNGGSIQLMYCFDTNYDFESAYRMERFFKNKNVNIIRLGNSAESYFLEKHIDQEKEQ
jgi:hypothetical protein